MATDATPESVRSVFGKSQTLAFGASFGVIGVLPPKGLKRNDGKKLEPTEIATFRSDGQYSDGRRPDSVHYGNAEQDALRRDFTINGLFYDPKSDSVVDFVGGQADLKRGVLQTIGDPVARFGEDKLRMLRAVRFATSLDFKIAEATHAAIVEHSGEIAMVSGERIGAEMRRVMQHPNALAGLNHLVQCKLHHAIMPELESADWNRIERLMQQKTQREFPISLACVLASLADAWAGLRAITNRWKLSNEETRIVGAAIKHWSIIAQAANLPWSQVQPRLIDRDAQAIWKLAATIVEAEGHDDSGIRLTKDALSWAPEKLDPPVLLSGDSLRELGIAAGPQYKTILQAVRDAQLNKQLETREEAIALAMKLTVS